MTSRILGVRKNLKKGPKSDQSGMTKLQNKGKGGTFFNESKLSGDKNSSLNYIYSVQ